MSISRQKLYAAGEPFGDSCTRIEGGRLILGGGGGGGSKQIDQRYAGLESLYNEQAASARLLRDQAEKYLPVATDNYAQRVAGVVGEGYKERQADVAGSDIASANAAEREATERSLSSMGVNPNDPRFVGSARSTEVSNAARMAAGKNAARNDAEKYQLAVSQDAVGTFTGQSNSAASQMAGASNGMASVAGQQAQVEANKQAQRSQNVSNAVGGTMAAWSMFKDGGKVRPSYGVTRLVKRANGGAIEADEILDAEPKMLERHAMGDIAGSQQKTQHGFFQMNQITPPPVAQQPQRPQQQGPSPLQYAAEANKAKQAGSITDRMAARGAENTDKMGRIASHFSEDAGNQISSNAAGQRMAGSPDQARAASDAYRAAAAEAKDAAAAQTYETTAANIDAGAGIEAASASTPAATTGAGAAAEGGLAATAPGVAGEVGAMASGAGTAGSAGAAAGTTAATTGTLGAAAPGVSSAVGAAASGAGAAGAGAAGASTAAATTAATTAASTGLGTAAAAIGTAMPWIGAAMVVGSLLGAWKDGGKIGGDKTPADEFSGAFNGDNDIEHLADGGKAKSMRELFKGTGAGAAASAIADNDRWEAAKDYTVVGQVAKGLADGGEATQDLRDGAAVEGPGGHTDDIVPALLSNGEGVLNGEAMALGGEAVMEDLNKKGLELRKQGVTPDEIRSRGYGLSKLKRKEVA